MFEATRNLLRYVAHHPIGERQRLRSLGRVVAWRVRSRMTNGPIRHPWINGSTLVVKRGMVGATGNVYLGLHEFSDMGFVLHFLRPGDLFYDVGANVGTYTVLAAAAVGARAVSFEPDPDTVAHLRANIVANGVAEQVTIEQCALGETPGEIAFTVGLDTMNRVAHPGERQRTVPVKRLDDVAASEPPIMMKIDVEGFEEEVLAGASATLANARVQALLTEDASPAIEALLTSRGFVRRFYNPFTRSLSEQANRWHDNNALYVRGAALEEIAARVASAPPVRVCGERV